MVPLELTCEVVHVSRAAVAMDTVQSVVSNSQNAIGQRNVLHDAVDGMSANEVSSHYIQ